MTRIAITGHASLDHVALIDGAPQAGRTTTILERPADAWPRLGGSPAYVAGALVAAGIADAVPISWVGDDADGAEYRRRLQAQGISAAGIATVEGARTPVALLAYEPQGGCVCLYHPGMRQDLTLSESQRALVAAADWVCVTVGPPSIAEAVLATIAPDRKLAWVVKHDPRSISGTLAARLAARADLICLSHAESGFLREAAVDPRPGRILIETRGRAGATLTRDGESTTLAASPLAVADPTGAGDSFAGGVIAALARGEAEAEAILGAGHRAARQLLLGRQGTTAGSA
jgi:ribokinase